jgi:hypothetical protein
MAFYHDQHLAWQQRVSKEITAASKFYRYLLNSQYQPMPKFSPSPNSAVNKPLSSNTSKQLYQTTYSKNSGVYAEVRGKYARPPPLMQKTGEYSFLAPKDISLLSRPSTSGSLKPRSVSVKSSAHSEVNNPEELNKKPQSASFAEKVRQEVLEKPKDEDKKPDDAEKAEEFNEKHEEPAEELEKIKENQDDFLRDGLSYVSGLTTTSQRKYILELESLLRQEKLKRIQLEESLKQATGAATLE